MSSPRIELRCGSFQVLRLLALKGCSLCDFAGFKRVVAPGLLRIPSRRFFSPIPPLAHCLFAILPFAHYPSLLPLPLPFSLLSPSPPPPPPPPPFLPPLPLFYLCPSSPLFFFLSPLFLSLCLLPSPSLPPFAPLSPSSPPNPPLSVLALSYPRRASPPLSPVLIPLERPFLLPLLCSIAVPPPLSPPPPLPLIPPPPPLPSGATLFFFLIPLPLSLPLSPLSPPLNLSTPSSTLTLAPRPTDILPCPPHPPISISPPPPSLLLHAPPSHVAPTSSSFAFSLPPPSLPPIRLLCMRAICLAHSHSSSRRAPTARQNR